jgi:solute carrier family 8 (sodium/calcium exchanger)
MDFFAGKSCHLPVKMLAATLLVLMGTQVGPSEAIPMVNGTCAGGAMHCKPGVIIPMWMPQTNLSGGDKAARAIVYFVCMVFMFLGVSIIADRFMSAIEVITSKEREVTVKKSNGETQVVTVRIWNETVSNLTLMALGSSAPEILLSIIEIIGNGFEAGDLGPGTIVGSAAFNLFVIIGLCVYVIPDGEVRKIKHLPVFFVTATWSIFAYLWMYLIIAVISPGRVDVWEGVLTFIFFPITVLTAYVADRRIYFNKFLKKKYRTGKSKAVVVTEGDMELGDKTDEVFKGLDSDDKEIREFEKHRREFIEIMRELRKKHPNMDMASLEEMAEVEAMNRGPKSRAFYRIQATRKLTGGGNVIKKKAERKSSLQDIKVDLPEDDNITRIFFEPGHYTVMENVGTFSLTVSRMGGNLNNTVYVDYRTEDGTANAGSDYEYAEGTLIFHPGETHKQFSLTIIDDDVFEEDEHFYVRLSNIRVGDAEGMFTDQTQMKAQLANPSMATIMILDDDHAGIFHFELKEMTFPESIGEANVKVCRSSGARGCVKVPYKTIDGTARSGKDFMETEGELYFEDDQTEEYIKVRVVDDEEYEKNEVFYIELGEPRLVKTGGDELDSKEENDGKDVEDEQPKTEEDDKIAQLGKPRLGDLVQISCHIRESMEFKSTVDKLIKQANLSLVVGTSSWREQFIEAITVSSGDDDDGEEGEEGAEEKLPSCMDYVMHFLTVFWKILFAFVPPTDYWGGWACFTVSILMIGLLTGIIGDIASGFGCSIGLKDSVCAISFVALGTSLPDTFASKVAAINDDTADSSVGNVTGSNAVNVFLGIGIAWTIAALKHAFYGTVFLVEPGSLAFSVTVFCVFAFVAIIMMVIRRNPLINGELGGPRTFKIITSTMFICLWLGYLLLSAFESYCYIEGF